MTRRPVWLWCLCLAPIAAARWSDEACSAEMIITTVALGLEADTIAKQKCRPSPPLVFHSKLRDLPNKLFSYIFNIYSHEQSLLLLMIWVIYVRLCMLVCLPLYSAECRA